MNTHVSTIPVVGEQLVLDIDAVHALTAVGLVEVSDGQPYGGLLALRTVPADAVVTEWLAYTHDLEADRATLDDTRAELVTARSIPAHAQELADNVRQALGRPSCYHSADVAAALALFDLRLRGAR